MISFEFRAPYFREKRPHIHWTGNWEGFRIDLDMVEKRKIPASTLNMKRKLKYVETKVIHFPSVPFNLL